MMDYDGPRTTLTDFETISKEQQMPISFEPPEFEDAEDPEPSDPATTSRDHPVVPQSEDSSADTKTAAPMDIVTNCRTFPALPKPLIARDHILDTIDRLFEDGVQIVAITGEEGSGKTTLLQQFALRHAYTTIGLFARSTSRIAYDPLYLQADLCQQLRWLALRQGSTGERDDDTQRRLLIGHLQGRAQRERQPYYFVIDGLDDIPDEHALAREQILELVPFGLVPFRFLYAGSLAHLPESLRKSADCTPFSLTSFSLDETKHYFADLTLPDDAVEELHRTWRGLPLRLAQVRRILQGGTSIETLIAQMSEQMPDLFALEWATVLHSAPSERTLLEQVLAIVAHERSQHTIADLSRFTGANPRQILALLRPLRFLHLDLLQEEPDASEDYTVRFESESLRRYAASQLQDYRDWAITRVVNDLLAHPQSDAALTQLPTYLRRQGRLDELFAYLQSPYFEEIVQRQQSFASALTISNEGMRIAQASQRDIDAIRLELIHASLLDLVQDTIDTHEVEARLAIGDEDTALALAQTAPMREDRLYLLAIIAKERSLRGERQPPELLDQMRLLVDQLDMANLPPDTPLSTRRSELATTLLFSLPDVAMRLLEQLEGQPTPEDANEADHTSHRQALSKRQADASPGAVAADLLFGEIPVPALHLLVDRGSGEDMRMPLSKNSELERVAFERLSTTLAHPIARHLAGTMALFLGGQAPQDALSLIDQFTKTHDQVFLLRYWALQNPEHPQASVVVEAALDRLLRGAHETAPTAAIYRDLATPLPILAGHNPATVETLIGRFDSQADLIERLGPSLDYIRLQLTLALAESSFNSVKANSRFIEIWSYSARQPDLALRAEALAHLLTTGEKMRVNAAHGMLPEPVSIADLAGLNSDLDRLVEELLVTTADHTRAFSGIIGTLIQSNPHRAFQIAQQLNTKQRRNRANAQIVGWLTEEYLHRLSTAADDRVSDAGDSAVTRAQPPGLPSQQTLLSSGQFHGEQAPTVDTQRGRSSDSLRPSVEAERPEHTLPVPATQDELVSLLHQTVATLAGTSHFDNALVRLAIQVRLFAESADRMQWQPSLHAASGSSSWSDNALRGLDKLYAFADQITQMADARLRCLALANWLMAVAHLEHHHSVPPYEPQDAGQMDTAQVKRRLQNTSAENPQQTQLILSQLVQRRSFFQAQLRAAWNTIDPGWRKQVLGYELTQLLASVDQALAQNYLQEVDYQQMHMRLPSNNVAVPYIASISLAQRAFAGVLKQRAETAADLARLEQAIQALPSFGEQAAQWADLALRYYLHNRMEEARTLVQKHVHPLLDQLERQDRAFYYDVIARVAPALYVQHAETAKTIISAIPHPMRDEIYRAIAFFFLYRTVPGDPYLTLTPSDHGLTYANLLDICAVIEQVEQDYVVAALVEELADAVALARRENRLAREQQRNLAERIRSLIETRLPQVENIQHEGFKVLALAQILRIDPTQSSNQALWEALFDRARKLPNHADQAYVLGQLAPLVPETAANIRKQFRLLVEESKLQASQLPTAAERIEHLVYLAEALAGNPQNAQWRAFAKDCLKDAMQEARQHEREVAMQKMQRRMVDLAYQFDESFAAELAARTDDDPARLANRLRLLELRKTMGTEERKAAVHGDQRAGGHATTERALAAPRPSVGGFTSAHLPQIASVQADQVPEPTDYPMAAWMALGALHSERRQHVRMEQFRPELAIAGQLPLGLGYPIFALLFENNVLRYQQSDQVGSHVRSLFECALSTAELTERLAGTAATHRREVTEYSLNGQTDGNERPQLRVPGFFRAGEREQAKQFNADWVQKYAREYLLLADPFFGPEDLEWVLLLQTAAPECHITVVTSRKWQLDQHVADPWEDAYRQKWALLSEQGARFTNIVFLGMEHTQKSPIHDRYLLTQGRGLCIGTSFNGIGRNSQSKISECSTEEATSIQQEINAFLQGRTRMVQGERVLVSAFYL